MATKNNMHSNGNGEQNNGEVEKKQNAIKLRWRGVKENDGLGRLKKRRKGSTILKLINVEVCIHECAPPTKLKICTFQT